MSFVDFSNYRFGFNRLDAKLTNKDDQKKYYDKWMRKYAKIFRNEEETLISIEWDLRCRKALREIFSSATFYTEAKKNLEMRCFSSYYFCLYYALFHSVYASIFLDVDSSIDKLLAVTHRNIINVFVSAFANAKTDIMTRDIKASFINLQYRREYYSYVTPFNNIFNYQEDLQKLREILLDCYQLASFHSLMVEKSYAKHVNKITKFNNADEIYEFDLLFRRLFSKKDESKRGIIDASCEFMWDELMQYGFQPEYISLDLDHQFDEFHTYDGFYDDSNGNDVLQIADIWLFVAEALMQSPL